MDEHYFKALQTFRGWSDLKKRFVFGTHFRHSSGTDLILDENGGYLRMEGFNEHITFSNDNILNVKTSFFNSVVKESIGIYTGRDDATKWEDRPDWLKHIPKEDWTGVPIFAGLPEKGNIGGDKCAWTRNGVGIIGFQIFYKNGSFITDTSYDSYENIYKIENIEVIGTQYEQHQKETKC